LNQVHPKYEVGIDGIQVHVSGSFVSVLGMILLWNIFEMAVTSFSCRIIVVVIVVVVVVVIIIIIIYLGDSDVGGSIILKLTIMKQRVAVSTGTKHCHEASCY
jgi:protein-S-isoprenylcysteine O-methyltransferase Ste14